MGEALKVGTVALAGAVNEGGPSENIVHQIARTNISGSATAAHVEIQD